MMRTPAAPFGKTAAVAAKIAIFAVGFFGFLSQNVSAGVIVTLLVLLGLTGVAYSQAPGANIDAGSAISILKLQTMALMKYQHADFKDVALSKNSNPDNPDGAASYILCGGIRRPSAGGAFQRFVSFFTLGADGEVSNAAVVSEHQSKTTQFQAQFNKAYDMACRKK
jgi:hypothetical protein